MSDNKKKRIVEGYEITQAVQIGDREVVFGDTSPRIPFL